MRLSLKLVNGQEFDYEVNSTTVIIGRSNKCDVVVPHEGISRQHCQIEHVGEMLYVTDLGSTNGVIIDGERIEPGVRTPYLTYLSLSFGAVQTAQIFLPGATSTNVKNPLKGQGPLNQQGSETRTLQLEIDQRPQRSRSPKKKIEEKERLPKATSIGNGPLSPMNFLAALIVAGAIFWYMTREERPAEDFTSGGPSQSTPAPKQTEDHF